MRWWLALVFCVACGSGNPSTTNGTTGTNGGTNGTSGGTTGTSSDPHIQHNLDELNRYRSMNGAPPLALSDALNAFAKTGSEQLAAGGPAHGHFSKAGNDGSLWSSGFCNGAGENQAPGWPVNGDEDATIDAILKSMMDEGPGGGHHDNIVNPKFRLVGVGLVVQNGGLYFTNDFSNACP